MKAEDQKRKDFFNDLLLLADQYGYEGSDVLDILNAKPKTKEDVLLDYARINYVEGVEFIPVNKKKSRVSNGNVEVLFDSIWAWNNNKLWLVYDVKSEQWAEIIN